MGSAQVPPNRSINFGLEWMGTQWGFQRIQGIGAKIDVIDYRNGNDPTPVVKSLGGLTTHPAVICEQGQTDDVAMYTALQERAVAAGGAGWAVEDITVTVYDLDGTTPVAVFMLIGAWPSEWSVSELNAMRSAILIETISFRCAEIKRTS
jgi:phage tail-like protein